VQSVTQKAVQQAFASHDTEAKQKYARFLEPILHVMIAKESDPAKVAQLQSYLQSVYNSLVAQLR
jgi:precorrin-4 methylase